jgi:hypothetical protein
MRRRTFGVGAGLVLAGLVPAGFAIADGPSPVRGPVEGARYATPIPASSVCSSGAACRIRVRRGDRRSVGRAAAVARGGRLPEADGTYTVTVEGTDARGRRFASDVTYHMVTAIPPTAQEPTPPPPVPER